MRRLLTRVAETIATEKDIVKELKWMAERLKAVDENPDKDLSLDEANVILGKLFQSFLIPTNIMQNIICLDHFS